MLGIILAAFSLGPAASPAFAAGSADMEITQTAAPTPVGQGAELTWAIVVTNHGPDDATGVEVNDNFNEFGTSTEFVSLTSTQGTCTNTSSTFNCQLGTVRSGGAATMMLTVKVLNTSSVVNVGDVTSSTSDPDWGNNHVSTAVPAGPSADLQLSKTASPASAAPGDTVTYTVTVRNAGPSNASGVELADSLPSGLENATVAPADACTVAGADVSCTPGSIASGGSFTATVTATIDPAFTGSRLSNAAGVVSTTIDPELSNNTATANVEVEAPAADLAVTKTTDTDPVVAGEPIRYTVTVSNDGPGEAVDATLSDPLPAELSDARANTDLGACTVAAGAVGCDLGTIPAGAAATVVVEATVASSATGQLTNTATATSSTPDPNPGNNTATSTTEITASADLTISKVASTAAATNGDPISYTLVVANDGPSDATGVTVTDPLPADLVYDSCTTPQGTCAYAAGTLAYELGTLTAGQSVTLGYATTVSGLAPGARIVNTATVSSGTPDPVPANDSASYAVNVDAAADLSLTKTASPSPAVAGEPVTFTLTAHNTGPGVSENLVLSDAVPPTVHVTDVSPSAGACDSGTSNTVHCTLDALASGSDWTVTVTGVLDAATPVGLLRNTATVTGDNDPTSSNNTATAVVRSVTTAALELTKSAPSTVIAGEQLTYSLVLSNAGPSSATDAVVSDTLPAGTRFVSASGASCAPQGSQFVRCTLGSVAPRSTAAFTITVQVAGQTPDGTVLVNRAQASSSVPGSSTGIGATASTRVSAIADLATVKTVLPGVLIAGGHASYSIRVANHGPSTATDVAVGDDVPAELTITSASPASGSCTTAGNRIECHRDALSSGATWAIVVHVEVAQNAGGTITNSATATSATTDPDPGDNTGNVTAQVQTSADLRLIKSALFPTRTPGQTEAFFLTTVNRGPSAAADAIVTDTFPAGLTPTSAPSACTITGQTVSCAYASIPSGATRTALVIATVDPDAAGALTNSATVAAGTPDPNPDDNTAQATVTVRATDPPPPDPDGPGPDGPGGRLPDTGSPEAAGPMILALASLVLGSAAIAAASRRRVPRSNLRR